MHVSCLNPDTFALVDYVNQALKGELQTPVCTNYGEAINLTRSWRVDEPGSPDKAEIRDSGICPYKGLEFFDCNDLDPQYFFGRDRLIGDLLDYVSTFNFLALVGASGNGKSSVLRAGLLHQLKLGRLIDGSEHWRIRLTRPEHQPMLNLALAFVDEGLSDLERAEALGRASGLLNEGAAGLRRLIQASTAPRVILVIDQFEEVFTRCESVEERERYFDCLMGALSKTDNKLCLIVAMRADFVGKCLERQYSGLAQQIQQNMISVLPMEEDELRAAICKPAELVGLEVEPVLVTEILNDVKGAPGSLPLLQYTLKELWNKRQGNQLVLRAYQALGGINGTLDKRATEIYNGFEEAEQLTVQHIFLQLTQLGEGTEDTRRRVFQTDLIAEPKHPAARVEKVIDDLSNPENRLLVTSEVVSKADESERKAIVDVAHEALIRHWGLLREWIEENRDILRQKQKIETEAEEWKNREFSRDYLLQGKRLREAKEFKYEQSQHFPLSPLVEQFIKDSDRKKNISLLLQLTFVLISIIFGLSLIWYMFRIRRIKEIEKTQELTKQSIKIAIIIEKVKPRNERLTQLLELAIKNATELQNDFVEDSPQKYRTIAPIYALQQVVDYFDSQPPEQLQWYSSQNPVWSLGFSVDGQFLATGGWDRKISLWDLSKLNRLLFSDFYESQ